MGGGEAFKAVKTLRADVDGVEVDAGDDYDSDESEESEEIELIYGDDQEDDSSRIDTEARDIDREEAESRFGYFRCVLRCRSACAAAGVSGNSSVICTCQFWFWTYRIAC